MSVSELLKKIDTKKLPQHIAIIMDGNGRWAKKHNLPRLAGHREGVKTVKKVVELGADLGIKVLTLYAFSVENWIRPKMEIKGLMNLLVIFLRRELKNLVKNNIKFIYSGDIGGFPKEIQKELIRAFEITKSNTGLVLNLALNYGGRDEIIKAVNDILSQERSKHFSEKNNITQEVFSRYLYTANLPDPDLLIRTSGEIRISNFLLWQIAYTELYFTSVLWPDFKEKNFLEAIIDYQKRERRFGGL